MPFKVIVVTDLDGTLLDHNNYEYVEALPALQTLEVNQIPLILNSSKTAAEMLRIRSQLGNTQAFIVENGSAIYVPEIDSNGEECFTVKEFGMNRADIIKIVHKIRQEKQYKFIGFSDMTTENLVAYTGLAEKDAQLALQRGYSEPIIWQDSEEKQKEFSEMLKAYNIFTVMGGRFLHLAAPVDKGMALTWLQKYYAHDQANLPKVIALGDSENDRAMLEAADYAVLVKSPVKKFPAVTHSQLIKTKLEGPAGWNEAILVLLKSLAII